MLPTADLDYPLPPGRIATHPAHPRDAARLLVVPRADPSTPQHRSIRDLPDLLRPGDLLVFNTSRVIPARFRGVRAGTGGRIEGLYLHDEPAAPGHPPTWACLIKGRHTRPGAILNLHDRAGRATDLRLLITGRPQMEPEAWTAQLQGAAPGDTTPAILDRIGLTPLPPYILKARRDAADPGDDAADRDEYQTVYAREPGSIAAPTAGLHFTPALLERLADRSIGRAEVTLHVGAGTFRPVETEFVEQHPMHAEWCSMPAETLRAVQETRQAGGRVIPVGTTAARTLESYALALEQSPDPPPSLTTNLLITPGFAFRWTDALLTNFHLPRSTLMALVAAFIGPDGVNTLKRLYAQAVAHRYRFYSFGDAMLIL